MPITVACWGAVVVVAARVTESETEIGKRFLCDLAMGVDSGRDHGNNAAFPKSAMR
jgi:hypothetical protein